MSHRLCRCGVADGGVIKTEAVGARSGTLEVPATSGINTVCTPYTAYTVCILYMATSQS